MLKQHLIMIRVTFHSIQMIAISYIIFTYTYLTSLGCNIIYIYIDLIISLQANDWCTNIEATMVICLEYWLRELILLLTLNNNAQLPKSTVMKSHIITSNTYVYLQYLLKNIKCTNSTVYPYCKSRRLLFVLASFRHLNT